MLYNIAVPIHQCKRCGRNFYVKPSHVLRGWGKYCTAKCLHLSMKTGRLVKCHTCFKDVYRTPRHFKRSANNKFYCSKECFAVWKNANLLIGEKNANWKGGENSYRAIIKRAGIMPKCSSCGISDRRVLVVHHIDSNRKNNVLSNLKWLCRNCHYLAHNGKTF